MIQVSAKHNIREFRRTLSRIERRHFPAAVANALTSTAFDCRAALIDVWQRSVTVRSKAFMRAALRVRKATQRLPTATVYDRLNREAIARQAFGEIKRPRSSRNLAIPITAGRTAGGKIRKAQQPRNLARSFVVRTARGKTLIMQRRSAKSAEAKPVYVLKPTARVPRRFPVRETATRIMRERMTGNLRRSLDRELAKVRTV